MLWVDWFSPEEPRLAWLPLPHSLSQQAEEDHSPEAPRLALALQRSSQPLYLHVYPQTPCKQVLPFCTLQNISAPEEMPDLSLQERSVIAQPAIKLKCPLITPLRQGNVRSSPEGRHRLWTSVRAFWNLSHETRHTHSLFPTLSQMLNRHIGFRKLPPQVHVPIKLE